PPPPPGSAAASEIQARPTQAFSKEALEAAARAARSGGLLGGPPPHGHVGPPPRPAGMPPMPPAPALPAWGAPTPKAPPILGSRGGDTERMEPTWGVEASRAPEPAPTAKPPEQLASPGLLLRRAEESAMA